MRKLCGPALVFGLVVSPASAARAGEVTRVATSFEEDNRFDLHFGVAYDYNFKQAAILREWNTGSPSDDATHLVKDLIYQQQRHIVTPSLEIGLWHDLSVYAALPIIVHDQRHYDLDQRPDDCEFGDTADFPDVNCVNKDNSTTIRDGIVPRNGFDATDTGAPYSQFTDGDTQRLFRGPVRRGLDQLHVGIKYGILNQNKFSHLPNWVIAAEGRFALGRAMTFSRDVQSGDPDGNHRVGRRIHELGLWTALSRRHRFLEPFFTAFWRQSLRASGSQFQDFSDEGEQGFVQPQSTAGISVGTEIIPWERKAKQQKVAFNIEGAAVLHYGGRAYSEIWELLADSPALVGKTDPASSAGCDVGDAMAFAAANPGDPEYVEAGGPGCTRFNGITTVQDYGTFALNMSAIFHMGPYARLILGANVQTDTRHFLTYAERGDDLDGDDAVDRNSREVNPVRREVIDAVGRRYAIDDVLNVYGYANLLFTF